MPRNEPPPDSRTIAELVERLGRIVRADEHKGGLNPAQWEALRYLARCNRFSNTPGALTRYLAATKGTVSQTLNALERKGLVERRPDPSSGRVVRLNLTRAGRALAARDPLAMLADAAATCDGRTRAAAADALTAMLGALQRANGLLPFGVCHTCRHFRPNAADGSPHWCALLEQRLNEADSRAICVEHSPLAA